VDVLKIGLLLDRTGRWVWFPHAGFAAGQFGCWLIKPQGFDQVWTGKGGIDAWSVEVDRSWARY